MKTKGLVFVATVMLLTGCATNSATSNQETNTSGYTITDDSIVFVFDVSRFKYVTNQHTGEWERITKIPIRTVAVAGDFNNWNRNSHIMENQNGIYQLAFPLSDFQKNKMYQFKFVINEQWWVEPTVKMSNTDKTNLGNRSSNFSFIIQ